MIQTSTPRVTAGTSAAAGIVQTAVVAGLAVGVLLVVATTRADVDLWGHVRFGLDTLRSGHIDRIDPYSFTSDRMWLNHEWLSELVMAIAWQRAGNAGLVALKLACIAASLGFLYATLRRSETSGRTSILLLGLALVGILPRVNHVRPQLFSVVLFAALILIFTRAERATHRAAWTVPLLALWANLHGGWIVGLGTVGLWSVAHAWDRRAVGARALTGLVWCGAAAAATLLNPYGAGLWRFLLETVGLGREAITEWAPLWTNPPLLALWAMFAGIGVFAATRSTPAPSAAALVIPAAWGVLSVRVSRLDAFFALAVIGMLGPRLDPYLRGPATGMAPVTARLRALVAAAVVALALSIPAARRPLTCIGLYDPWWPEPGAVRFMQQQGLSGRVVTFFRWGEYGIWHMPPGMKVSLDGRRETVYSDALVRGHLELYAGTPVGLQFLDGLNADYVWFPRALPVTSSLEARGWIRIFAGAQSILLARQARPGAEAPAAPDEGRRCFPGP